MNVQHQFHRGIKLLFIGVCMVACAACSHQSPTIAHTHIGHAITAFDGTPGEKSLFAVAEERAQDALTGAEAAARANQDLSTIKRQIEVVVDATRGDGYGLKHALFESVKHINFAANAEDASDNVKRGAQRFEAAADGVLNRCDLISLLANDVLVTNSLDEGRVLAGQINQLAATNLGASNSAEVGVVQLRALLDDMINSEDPKYETVDRWYLFHLVRLPNCNSCWAWRKWANSSNRGY